MDETTQQRIERLTELAEKALPHLNEVKAIAGVDGAQVVARSSFPSSTCNGSPGEYYTTTIMRIPAPRSDMGVALALDAMEAALLVLAGEAPNAAPVVLPIDPDAERLVDGMVESAIGQRARRPLR